MKTFFILGREPALSLTEILSVIRKKTGDYPRISSLSSQFLIINDQIPEPNEFIKTLGGTIKIGSIKEEFDSNQPENVFIQKIIDIITKHVPIKSNQKLYFGLSLYQGSASGQKNVSFWQDRLKKIGIQTKRELQKTGRPVRWVTSAEQILSSVIVKTNKLLSSGAEVVLIIDQSKIKIGITEAVQPFEFLEKIDYGRPGREARVGMLPPKLARMMINLASAPEDINLLDPFCGSGTILTEALLLGYTKLIGADIDEKSIQRTRQNIDWLEKTGVLPKTAKAKDIKLITSDIRNLDSQIEPESINAIITELHLGPPLRGNETIADLEKIQKELTPLYNDALKIFHKLLQKNGLAVVAFPLLRFQSRTFLQNDIIEKVRDFGFEFISPIPNSIKIPAYLKGEFGRGGNTLIYGRPDQRVWREIAILNQS